jgi:hypothetical protein
MSKEAMKLALEALKRMQRYGNTFGYRSHEQNPYEQVCEAITSLETELAKPDFWEGYVPEPVKPAQQEPVACFSVFRSISGERNTRFLELASLPDGEHYFYTSPPAQQEPVAFLANGTRFKISYDSRQSGGQIHGIPPELGGRWVAFVAADDDCHLKLTSPPAQRTWVGLSEKEMYKLWLTTDEETDRMAFGKAVESKLKEKNT